MKTRELQRLWWDWLGTSERLLRSLAEQKAALTLRDLSRVERIQPELRTMMDRMKAIDELAAASSKRLAEGLGVKPSLRSLLGALDEAEARQLGALARRVEVAAANVQEAMGANKALIQSELTYVNGTLALIAKAAQHHEGPFASRQESPVLVDQAA
jgi:hypothetical protein